MQQSGKRVGARTLLVLLALILCGAGLLSCSTSPYTDQQVLAIFSELYEKSLAINEYVWGKGLPVAEYDSTKIPEEGPYFVLLAESAPYRTRESLMAAIGEVYTAKYIADVIAPMLFDGLRGREDYSPHYQETKAGLFRNVTFSAMEPAGQFLPETARVLSSSATSAELAVTYRLFAEGGADKEYRLTMSYGRDGWRFDSTTM